VRWLRPSLIHGRRDLGHMPAIGARPSSPRPGTRGSSPAEDDPFDRVFWDRVLAARSPSVGLEAARKSGTSVRLDAELDLYCDETSTDPDQLGTSLRFVTITGCALHAIAERPTRRRTPSCGLRCA